MLKPAQLYEKRLQEIAIEHWYDMRNIYWNGSVGDSRLNIPEDNYETHNFASVDNHDNILGYIRYNVNWTALNVYGFAAISFEREVKFTKEGFAKDLYQVICDIFEKYHLNRVSWSCYVGNPAMRGYRNFIKKFGGRECGYYRQLSRLQDGKIYDCVEFEILASEFKRHDKLSLRNCPICGHEIDLVADMYIPQRDWHPTFDDSDSGGDPICLNCKCGLQFCTGTYDMKKFAESWNSRSLK